VEEGLSVLSNYLLDQLRELTSRHTLVGDHGSNDDFICLR
jgi:hypothetical protein